MAAAGETFHKAFTLAGLRSAAVQSPGLVRLPQALRDAISSFLADHSSQDVKRSVARLAMSMRERKLAGRQVGSTYESDSPPHVQLAAAEFVAHEWKDKALPLQASVKYETHQTLAYVAARMPAVYAAIHRVFAELARRQPDFKPSTVLDYGSGPGTCLWAMRGVWPDTVKHVNLVERAPAMADACRALLKDQEGLPTIKSYASLQTLLRTVKQGSRSHDMVISSYALGELPTMAERISAVRQLWFLTQDVLVLIEPGTPEGFNVIQEMRNHILHLEKRKMRKLKKVEDSGSVREGGLMDEAHPPAAGEVGRGGAFVVAPCAHDGSCPMAKSGKWCHFAQRLERTMSQRVSKRVTKSALRAYEDEKFSFVVLRHGNRPKVPWPMTTLAHEAPEDGESDPNIFGEYLPPDAADDDSFLERDDADDLYSGQDLSLEVEGEAAGELRTQGEDAREAPTEPELDRGFLDAADADVLGEKNDVNQGGLAGDTVHDARESADVGGGWARIVHPPLKRGGHVILDVCSAAEGDPSRGQLQRLVAVRSGVRALYLQARKSRWGDLWPC